MQGKLTVEIYGCVYKKNAAICPILAAFFEENAAIVIRQSVVQMKGGDLWLRFHYRNAAIGLFWLRFLRKRSYRSAPCVQESREEGGCLKNTCIY